MVYQQIGCHCLPNLPLGKKKKKQGRKEDSFPVIHELGGIYTVMKVLH